MKLVLLPSAWDDLAEGFHFYEAQSSGLGDYFRESLIAEIERLPPVAGVHRRVFGSHRALAGKFPFAIYYTIADDTLLVRAVLDCRRDPAWLRKKLK